MLLLFIAAITSCKKDGLPDPSRQRPDLSHILNSDQRAVIEVRNMSARPGDEISQAFLSNSDTLGIMFAIKQNDKMEFTTSIIGANRLNVFVNAAGAGSVSVTDSDGTQQCKDITAGQAVVAFYPINISLAKKLYVTYRSIACN